MPFLLKSASMYSDRSDTEVTPLHEDDGYDDAGRPGTSPLTPRHRGGLACVLGVLVVGATVAAVRGERQRPA